MSVTVVPEGRRSFRLRVLDALTVCLKSINPANGYEFDLSDYQEEGEDARTGLQTRVFRGRDTFGDTDPVPMICILEQAQPLDQQTSQNDNPVITGPWDILIQGFVQDDPVHPTDPAHLLMGEVKAVLATEKKRRDPTNRVPDYLGLGNRKINAITGFSVGPGTVRPSDELSAKAYFYLVLSLQITEDTTQPYA